MIEQITGRVLPSDIVANELNQFKIRTVFKDTERHVSRMLVSTIPASKKNALAGESFLYETLVERVNDETKRLYDLFKIGSHDTCVNEPWNAELKIYKNSAARFSADNLHNLNMSFTKASPTLTNFGGEFLSFNRNNSHTSFFGSINHILPNQAKIAVSFEDFGMLGPPRRFSAILRGANYLTAYEEKNAFSSLVKTTASIIPNLVHSMDVFKVLKASKTELPIALGAALSAGLVYKFSQRSGKTA